MLRKIYTYLFFKLLLLVSYRKIKTNEKVIYLTFDDGPEPDITEFVLNILNLYNAKATFFCVGKNINKYKYLYDMIINSGHLVANHTYSHINGLFSKNKLYFENSELCEEFLDNNLFRPPWGVLSFKNYFKLVKRYKIVLWNVSSNDTKIKINDKNNMQQMIKKTKAGSIVLFHFSKFHENKNHF